MEYELRLDSTDVKLIVAALAELPIKVAGNTFSKVQYLVQQQDAARLIASQAAEPGPADSGDAK